MPRLRVRQAIVQALAEEMRADPGVLLLGEDIAEAEGPFKTSEGLLAEFGPQRVRDTPIAEMGFCGAAVGAAMMGLKPVVEIMFMEFLGVALDQVVTEAAKYRYLSQGAFAVPMVVRASVGSGGGFGTQHSQTCENWLTATPGLKVVVPSDVQSAYGLLRSAIQDPDPVVVLEPRALYGERGELVSGDEGLIAIGTARTMRTGSAVTIVALGQTVGIALRAVEQAGIDADVVDLSTVVPWDRETVLESVRRTGRLVTVEEAPHSGGWGSEIVADMTTRAFGVLKAAPFRITAPNVPVPFNRELEARFLPQVGDVAALVSDYVKSDEVPRQWWQQEGTTR